ncbi:hypothetical protein MMC18_007770 [Xylographa bjoerkii]|nr:hypothetical protein [Xylographa bjoerkii]
MSSAFSVLTKKRKHGKSTETYEAPDPSTGDSIVAVHGLDGHRELTWTAENGVLWLKTLLGSDLPQARVWSYGYDSSTHSRSHISRDTFYGHAQTLLGELTLERRYTKTEKLPIIFIAHSLGGLLVKKALVLSSLANESNLVHHKYIHLSTYAILFFGTPHQGADMISWESLLLKVGSIYYHTDDRLLQQLKSDSEPIEQGLGEFANIASKILMKYFYESFPTPMKAGGSMTVIKKSSAVPPSIDVEAIDTRRNHISMVKFGSASEALYKTIIKHLSLMLEHAPSAIEQNWAKWERSQANDTYSRTAQVKYSSSYKEAENKSVPSIVENSPASLNSTEQKRARPNPDVRLVTTPNTKFIGRKHELDEIHESLDPKSHDHIQVSCAIYGLGGVGKTQIAKQYFWKYRSSYSFVAWLRASDLPTLAQDFSGIAAMANGMSTGASNQVKNIEVAREWLEANPNWLLIFDNLDDIILYNEFRPTCEHGSILITTQDSDLAANATRDFSIKPLEEEEGARLLLQYVKHDNQPGILEQAKTICKELGGLPLAIVHVAGYIRQSQILLTRFLNNYREAFSQNFVENYTSLLEQYERTYSTVWSIALNELPADARGFIDTLAFFNADKVPEEVFLANMLPSYILGEQSTYSGLQADRSGHIDKMIRHLSKRSLIERTDGGLAGSTLAVHRQLRLNLLRNLSRDPARSRFIFGNAVSLLRYVFPRQNLVIEHMTQDWPQCARFVDQVLSFFHIYSTFPNPAQTLGYSLSFARILCDCGQYLWEQSLNQSAEQVLELAAKICDGNMPPDKPLALRASILFRQCSVEIDAGYSGILRAIPKFKVAIDIQHKVLEALSSAGQEPTAEDEIPLANGLNNLGCCYLHLTRYEEAESLFQESLSIKENEKWSNHGSMSYEFAESNKNIAIIRASQGRIEEALKLSLQSVTTMKSFAGSDSSRTYFFRFIYACILFDSGAIEQALLLHLEILEARKRLLSETHNYTASSYYMVGFTYYYLRRYSDAEAMVQESIEVWSKGHSRRTHIARAQYLLYMILDAAGRVIEANKARDNAREVLTELTGQAQSDIIENLKAYDSLVPVWNGRSFLSNSSLEEKFPNQPN